MKNSSTHQLPENYQTEVSVETDQSYEVDLLLLISDCQGRCRQTNASVFLLCVYILLDEHPMGTCFSPQNAHWLEDEWDKYVQLHTFVAVVAILICPYINQVVIHTKNLSARAISTIGLQLIQHSGLSRICSIKSIHHAASLLTP